MKFANKELKNVGKIDYRSKKAKSFGEAFDLLAIQGLTTRAMVLVRGLESRLQLKNYFKKRAHLRPMSHETFLHTILR